MLSGFGINIKLFKQASLGEHQIFHHALPPGNSTTQPRKGLFSTVHPRKNTVGSEHLTDNCAELFISKRTADSNNALSNNALSTSS
jgi:hypothetical protein